MKVLLVCNLTKPNAEELTKKVRDYLAEHNVTLFSPESQATLFSLTPYNNQEVDIIISLGGDGSILKIVHEYPKLLAPIMGINLGSLGFLADIPIPSIFHALDQVLAKAYSIQDRLMLQGHTKNKKHCLAVNDMVIHRGRNPGLVDLSVKVDGRYCNTFSADGLVIATPSGSTAYSLSSGGPILTPELEAVVITPICPHAITNRPIVLSMHKEIEITCLSNQEPVEVFFDGMTYFSLKKGDTFTICPAPRRFNIVTFENVDYFETLRQKLAWTGTLKIE